MFKKFSIPRFRLRFFVFCITVLLSVGAAFPGQCWSSTVGRSGTEQRSSRSKACFRSTTPRQNVDNNTIRKVYPVEQQESLIIRGGEEELSPEKEILSRYLRSKGEKSTSLDNFHIHGWRWHTRSFIREVGRLHTLASKSNLSNVKPLQTATDYVIDFNLRGLHKIEADLFFPWMRQQLTSLPRDREVCEAFATVMSELESDRSKISRIGKSIVQNADIAGDTRRPKQARVEAINAVADQSFELQECARNMKDLEDKYLVPAIASLVPEKEQKTFSNKVLRGLGLLDSRLHLVSMYEAVTEDRDRVKEEELFQKSIPSVPQMMIPRWKRNLYTPRTSMME